MVRGLVDWGLVRMVGVRVRSRVIHYVYESHSKGRNKENVCG